MLQSLFLLAGLLLSPSLAFVPSPRPDVVVRRSVSDGLTSIRSADDVNHAQLLSLGSSSMNHHDNEKDRNDNESESIDMLPLALKLAVIMGIKTVRDAVTYPTIYASDAVQSTRRFASDTNNQVVNVPVMFLKLVLIMTFKTIHDVLYYPAVYVFGRIINPTTSNDDDIDEGDHKNKRR
jgi:hypothetical protein